jgi:PAS domain S-box-containing protein
MASMGNLPGQIEEKRRRAEEILKKPPRRRQDQETLRKLQAYQIELERQNKDLRRVQAELDASRARYFDLYDRAPVGYCTLSRKGLIRESNLTAATLLGTARGALAKQPISRFILEEDREIYNLHSKQLFETGDPQVCELRMTRKDGSVFWVRMEATVAQEAAGVPVCRVMLSDITERKFEEGQRELTARLIVWVNTPGDLYKLMSATTASLQSWSGCESVGIRLRSGNDYPYYETCGFPPAFVQEGNHDYAYGPDGEILRDDTGYPVLECMCGNILCGRFDPAEPFFTAHGSFWSNSTTALLAGTTEVNRQARTCNRCNGEGYESVALIPLRTGQQIFGLLQFNDHRPDRFTPDLIACYEKMADNLAMALSRRQTQEALKESEERFQQLFDHMADGVAVYQGVDGGRDFVFVDINRTGQSISRICRDKVVGRRVTEIFPSVEQIGLLDVFRHVWRTGRPEYHPLTQYVDGRVEQWVENYVYKLPSGLIVAIYCDTSQKHRAEEALRESEQRYHRITEAITDYNYTVRVVDGNATEATHGPGCQAVTGYGENEFGNDPFLWFRMVAAEDRSKVEEQTRRILADEDPPPIEHRIIRKNGIERWVRSTVVPHRDEQDVLVAYDGLIQDITERKQAEEALKKSEMRFRELFDDAPIGYHELDTEGRITRVNRTELATLGYSAEEMLGRPVWAFIDEKEISRKAVMDKLAGILPPGYNSERTYCRKDGTRISMLFQDVLLRDKDGKITGIRTTVQDITERNRAEEEKGKLEAQLLQAQKMESVGRLAGGVAHDFNNMLGVIFGHCELALEQTDPAQPLHAHLEEIRKAASRSADLTRQLLAFARKQTIDPKVLDLNETVESMLKMLRRLIGEDIHLTWHPRPNLWPVKVDPSQIDQVLANLCVNARDAISGIGKMNIETDNSVFDEEYCTTHLDFTPGEYVRLAVSDNGCGMDKETLSHLFEPFFTTKEKGKGTGLGLATVYGIVKQNSGFINVYSEPDQGTTFKIYLPRYAGKIAQPRAEGPVEAAERGQETILVVEDEPAILDITTKILEKQGYSVLAANNPGDAMRLARDHTGELHLLMTDVVMPGMNGRDLAQKMRSLHPDLKCLYSSGYTADVIVHHGVLEEGVFFIQKPFSRKDLAAKIREILDREKRNRS